MDPADRDNLSLWSEYGDLYNEIVRPERKYTVSHYMRTRWMPLLGAARFWFVVALRQRCFWNDKQDWCVVDKETLARESGLSLRTVNRIIAAADRPVATDDRDGLPAWFFSKHRRRRYSQQIGRTVNAPNRYHVLLDDPLTPHDQVALLRYLREQQTDRSPEGTLEILQGLCVRSDNQLHEILDAIDADVDTSESLASAVVLDIVEAYCPMPQPESELYLQIAQAASRLHNALTRPERVYVGNQYFRLQWVPDLGPVLSSLVLNLRARCYWNERTGELRDTCRANWAELARELGCTSRQLRNLRQHPALPRFIALLSEGHGLGQSQFRIGMADPLTDADQARFQERLGSAGELSVDPETGQVDVLRLLAKAEVLAPGNDGEPPKKEVLASREAKEQPQAEALAQSPGPQTEEMTPSGRKLWHIDGLKAEVLAREGGNSGTTEQVQFITLNPKGLGAEALDLDPSLSGDPDRLAAAVRAHLLSRLGIQQPNLSKLLALLPRCDHIVAWGLYALTQPGLAENKAGYVYKRLIGQDPPPEDLLTLAQLDVQTWADLARRFRPGRRISREGEGTGSLAIMDLHFSQVWDDLHLDLPGVSDKRYEVPQATGWLPTPPAWKLPMEISTMLEDEDDVRETDEAYEIVTRDLYRAWAVTQRAREVESDKRIEVLFRDAQGQEHAVNAELLALGSTPLHRHVWTQVCAEMELLVADRTFQEYFRCVVPLGMAGQERVVLGVPTPEVRDWMAVRQTTQLRRTLSSILHHPVQVEFVVYGQLEPEGSALPL